MGNVNVGYSPAPTYSPMHTGTSVEQASGNPGVDRGMCTTPWVAWFHQVDTILSSPSGGYWTLTGGNTGTLANNAGDTVQINNELLVEDDANIQNNLVTGGSGAIGTSLAVGTYETISQYLIVGQYLVVGEFLNVSGNLIVGGQAAITGVACPTCGDDSGTANAYVVTTATPVSPTTTPGNTNGYITVIFTAANANTGASTLALNGGSPGAITKNGTTPLVVGDILAGQIITVTSADGGVTWQLPG